MARFVRKLCMFAVLFSGVLLAMLWLSSLPQCREWFAVITSSNEYAAGEGEAEQYIKNVSEDTARNTLILGDSVCHQMFHSLQDVNPDWCINGNNRGLTLAGEYLLLDEFLRHQDQVTDVYLIIGPDMLQSEIDVLYGYQYVVIPFARYDMLDRLEPETITNMKEMYGSLFLGKPIAKLIGDSSIGRKLYLNYLKEKYEIAQAGETGDAWVSETARLYLPKIAELCEQRQVVLHLLPTPQSDDIFRRDQITEIRQHVGELGLSEYFEEYFELLRFYPPEQFPDGTHFGGEYETQEYFNEVIREMYLENGSIEGFVTS